jgi:large subunit ribosomal protein L32
MPHPKRRHSSVRRDKRRTHYKAELPTLTVCPTTGQYHVPHTAHWYENKLYYRGKILLEGKESKKEA